ncbi:ATP/GTP-binding protein [Nocardia tengchongensis]|uniref:ATP/GTP-binding protein n=1 Tax=Nocardia tengchongensis TaxID=2055889 RepID=A0ABX8CNU7_9NOCA|nr:ATP/GTP-binding protein [Nocardia tengchongensis]QVI21626.1 ATP/GTP-binding protein [Nocardia tengchongensis]
MPRRKPRPKDSARSQRDPRPLGDVFGRTEPGPGTDDTFIVRTVPGTRATKPYRCPGCDQVIPPGTPHIVAWAAHDGEDDRRHWHTGCWKGRNTRTITRRWS